MTILEKQSVADYVMECEAQLLHFLENQSVDKWNFSPPDKWTTGQHIIHLTQGTQALNRGLKMPHLLLRYKFGKANRKVRTLDEVIDKYNEKLQAAGNVTSPFSKNMPETPPSSKGKIIQDLKAANRELHRLLNKKSNRALSTYLLPHPLMGRMIFMEIIAWSGYHMLHHLNILEEKYQ